MPRTSSAKKALRVAKTNAERNRAQRTALKRAVKAVKPDTTSATVSTIAKATKRGILSKARAARMISRIMRASGTAQLAKRPTAGAAKPAPAKKVAKATKPRATSKKK